MVLCHMIVMEKDVLRSSVCTSINAVLTSINNIFYLKSDKVGDLVSHDYYYLF